MERIYWWLVSEENFKNLVELRIIEDSKLWEKIIDRILLCIGL